MTGYDPGLLTKTYSNISGTFKKSRKYMMEQPQRHLQLFYDSSANGLSSNLNVTQ